MKLMNATGSLTSARASLRRERGAKSEVHKNLSIAPDLALRERSRFGHRGRLNVLKQPKPSNCWHCHNGNRKEAELKRLLRNVTNWLTGQELKHLPRITERGRFL